MTWDSELSQWEYSLCNSNDGDVDDGVYDPYCYTFTDAGVLTETGTNIDGTAWPLTNNTSDNSQVIASVSINGGTPWPHIGCTFEFDIYGDQDGNYLVLDGGYDYSFGGSTYSDVGVFTDNVFWSSRTGTDIRPVGTDGSYLRPGNTPTYGPPGIFVNGNLWYFAGTVTSSTSDVGPTFDVYLGSAGQNLIMSTYYSSSYELTDTTDGFSGLVTGGYNGVFAPPASGINILPTSLDGSTGTSTSGITSLWVIDGSGDATAMTWNFYANFNGIDCFVGPYAGQCLEINGSSVPASSLSMGLVTGDYYEGTLYMGGGSLTVLNSTGSPNFSSSTLLVNGGSLEFNSGGADGMRGGVDYYVGTAGTLFIQGTVASAGFTLSLSTGGTYTGTFSNGVFTIDGDTGLTIAPQPAIGPPVIGVNGVQYNYINSSVVSGSSYQDNYVGGITISGTSILSTSSSTGYTAYITDGTNYGMGYYYPGGAFDVEITGSSGTYFDVRPLNLDGSALTPLQPPFYGGPPAYWVEGQVWTYIGTANGAPGDLYAGSSAGQILWNNNGTLTVNDAVTSLAATGTNGTGPIALYDDTSLAFAAEIIPMDSTTLNTSPVSGPSSVTVSGGSESSSTWSFVSSPDGYDVYAGSVAGQYLILANSNNSSPGTVLVVDPSTGLSQTGTYSGGVFCADGLTITAN